MPLDVDPPAPPELDTAVDASDYDDVDVDTSEYRREELETFLQDGAWEQAFTEWAETSDLDETAFEIVSELDLVEQFDFFWDDFAQRVGYHAPGLPEDWRERSLHPDLDSWDTVSGINAGMAELGRTVSETLKADYVDWQTDPDLPDDLPEFGDE
ncbi:hypothetical protein [Halomicrobium katesii]|uniref:hypothetical protein n=1 Tax=Halomicrobium katesii TaxID=437163 RepID=UPI00037DA741|nr:hypothetical protein [Halomicrobium katesii]